MPPPWVENDSLLLLLDGLDEVASERRAACIEDVPGSLARLLSLVAEGGGNVLAIHHARGGRDLYLFRTRVDLEVETRGFDQIEEIKEALKAAGYEIRVRT